MAQNRVIYAEGEDERVLHAVRVVLDEGLAAPILIGRPEVIEIVGASDFVVLGPGSWFTSVIPHLLVPELAEALVETPAKRILTLNLRPADETDGYSASQHLEILADHAPRLRLDVIIADVSFGYGDRHLPAYAESLGARLVLADLAMRDGTPRHDPLRLASIYAEVMGV